MIRMTYRAPRHEDKLLALYSQNGVEDKPRQSKNVIEKEFIIEYNGELIAAMKVALKLNDVAILHLLVDENYNYDMFAKYLIDRAKKILNYSRRVLVTALVPVDQHRMHSFYKRNKFVIKKPTINIDGKDHHKMVYYKE